MRKISKLLISIFFISTWLILFSFIYSFAIDYWKDFHLEYIYLKVVKIFHFDFWFTIKDILIGFDLGFYLEELFRFITYEIPLEALKFTPIYLGIKAIWKKK